MKRLFIIPVPLLTLLIGILALAADYQKGVDAYKKKDYATALREWKPLAEQGHAPAQHNLAVLYERGHSISQDFETAVRWYKLAAEQEFAPSQNNLGKMYMKGLGVSQNYETAFHWYKLAAEQGSAIAQSNLGVMYVEGLGTQQDNIRGHMWLNLATNQGFEKAAKYRDKVTSFITATQLATALRLAVGCKKKKYKGC